MIYTPRITRDRPFLSAGTIYRGTVHAWFESVSRSGRRGPIGSRSLCGIRSRGWCVQWDGFTYYGPESIRDAESVSYHGGMCTDCRERLTRIEQQS